jgi:hypothetical protein
MEIYFKLKIRMGDTGDAHKRIETTLKEMAERAHEFPNGNWPTLRCGTEIGWFRNPVEAIGIDEVLEYYEIGADGGDKYAYIKGRYDHHVTLYSALRKVLKYQMGQWGYEKITGLKCIRRTLVMLIKTIDKLMLKEKEAGREW